MICWNIVIHGKYRIFLPQITHDLGLRIILPVFRGYFLCLYFPIGSSAVRVIQLQFLYSLRLFYSIIFENKTFPYQ